MDDEIKTLEKTEEVSITNTLKKVLNRYNIDDINLKSIESKLLLAIYCLVADNHVYNFDKDSNLLKGKRLDFELVAKICREYLVASNIPVPNITSFVWDDNEERINVKDGYFKDIVYQSIIRKKGQNNGDRNLQIKKNNFWTAYKAFKQGNKTGFRDAKKWAYDIVKDKFYDGKSSYAEFYKKFAWLYEKDKSSKK